MKRMTIKLKIALWFTAFMLLLSVIIFAFIALVSASSTSNHVRGVLTGFVDDNSREVEYDDGELDIDDDFISFKSGVYCLVFNDAGEKLSGYAPYDLLENHPFEDGSIRDVSIAGEFYLIYDRAVIDKNEPGLWVRGVVQEDGNSINAETVYRAAIIAVPLLIALAAFGGYLIAGHSLHPVREIGQTAENIGRSGDLSRRIELKENSKDELHRLADTFNRMLSRLETNFEAQRNFTSDASHELRTPVTTILAQCEYAFENAETKQELYEAIGAIQKQGYRMSRLIESLLQFTRMEQRTEMQNPQYVDISSLARTVCREYMEASDKNITLSEEIEPNVKMKADPSLITRMIGNLIQNAYRYGKENGNIKVSLRENESAVTLSVADDGIGISAADQPNIWNRFYQADKSRSNGGGLGLGLAMVKQIAELYGGTVQVESELDKGSLFTVCFLRTPGSM